MHPSMVEHKQHSTSLFTDGLFLTCRVGSGGTEAKLSLAFLILGCPAETGADDNGVWPLMTTVRSEPVARR